MKTSRRIAAAAFAWALTTGLHAATRDADSPSHAAAAAAKAEQQDWGIAGDARSARRTIEIGMTDAMRFTPSKLQVREGETVRFVVVNRGRQP
ncbi:MAG TPA: plastocyanin, partial [Ramlibacter sp.]